MKPSTQELEITLQQAVTVGREGYVDCPFCPAKLHCEDSPMNCSDVVRDCFKIVTEELERQASAECSGCITLRETVNRYRNMAQLAIDNLVESGKHE